MNFEYAKPKNFKLKSLIDSYFYVSTSLDDTFQFTEQIVPFPRVTFGYFFDAPFTVKNLSTNESLTIDIAIAKIQNTTVEVTPTKNEIKILGAHLKPYALSSFTSQHVVDLPWLINPFSLFTSEADTFVKKVNKANSTEELFDIVESSFLDILILRDLKLISKATDFIEENKGNCHVKEVAIFCECSERTVHNHFIAHIGTGPKDVIKLTKIKYSLYSMLKNNESLTAIAHSNNFSDQAHFINTLKNVLSEKPSRLRKKLPTFRFLQF